MKLKIGDTAPEFQLTDQNENIVSLEQFKDKKNVVLFFYPKDFTMICTAEVCAFRDSYEKFKNADTEVIGISSDDILSHKKFSDEHNVSFSILSDTDNSVRKKYNAITMGIIPDRITFVIDKNGIIKYIFSSQLTAEKHMENALNIVSGF